MGRNIIYSFGAVQALRDEAHEIIDDLFPKARVELGIARFAGEVGVSARIIGDTAPYKPTDIIDCLNELGVKQIKSVESQRQSTA